MSTVMIDLEGVALSADEKKLIEHPNVGGVLLFTRNYQNPDQLKALVQDIRAIRESILIAVDHEGGRVWRFKEGFHHLPPAAEYAKRGLHEGKALAFDSARIMATELLACGIDLSFAPVLDVDKGISEVIGDRAFDSDPSIVSQIAGAFIEGMNAAGMQATGKHFPGHGGCAPDSHVAKPIDEREWSELQHDMLPFAQLIHKLGAIMPAHIVFPKVDGQPVGFSEKWLHTILREQLGFQGVIISDCLSMKGSEIGGSLVERSNKALAAGCDIIIVAQKTRAELAELLDAIHVKKATDRLATLKADFIYS